MDKWLTGTRWWWVRLIATTGVVVLNVVAYQPVDRFGYPLGLLLIFGIGLAVNAALGLARWSYRQAEREN